MKKIVILAFLLISVLANAQTVKVDNNTYKVKGKKILLDGKDVTQILSETQKTKIFNEAKAIEKANKRAEKEEKEKKEEEKEKKEEEKEKKEEERKKKKKEKEKRKKENIKKDINKAERKLDKAKKKYNNLDRKGKLSPVDKEKWTDKIERLTKDLEKRKKRA